MFCAGHFPVIPKPHGSMLLSITHDQSQRFRTARSVGERRQSQQSPRNRGPNPRVLTSKIAKAESAAAILKLVSAEMDSDLFNDFHLSVSFSRLAKFSQRNQLSLADTCSSIWPSPARLCAMLRKDELSARAAANVFWALGELYEHVKAFDGLLVSELGIYLQQKVQ